MAVIHVTKHAYGGAGSAVCLYHDSLKKAGVESFLITQDIIESRMNKFEVLFRKIRARLNFLNRRRKYNTLYGFYDYSSIKCKQSYCKQIELYLTGLNVKIDEIVFYWTAGFVSSEEMLKLKNIYNCKVTINMVDMQHITGGCHYSYNCIQYMTGCFNCPAVTCNLEREKVALSFNKKMKNFAQLRADVTCPVQFALDQAKKSVVPFSNYRLIRPFINFDKFYYQDSHNKTPTILIGAYNPNDKRKGFELALSSLFHLDSLLSTAEQNVSIMLPSSVEFLDYDVFSNIDIIKYEFANNEEDLRQLYLRSDLFLSTSLDDTGPTMIWESLACGIPVVTTRTGLAEELISSDRIFGRISENQCGDEIAKLIMEVLFYSTESKRGHEIESCFKKIYLNAIDL